MEETSLDNSLSPSNSENKEVVLIEKKPLYNSEDNKQIIQEDSLEEKRKRLFEEGSSFRKVERKDIVGIDNTLQEIDSLIDWLNNYDTYSRLGARPEPGILFCGEPGTGKTTCARYLASSSDALFVDVRDFPYQGDLMSVQDIQALFSYARKTIETTKKPLILFWDEFEGYAKNRKEASPEQGALISQITAELDGIYGKTDGLLLVACTNYYNLIDEALLRPGRMGLRIGFGSPSIEGTKKLIHHYSQKYPFDESADLKALAYHLRNECASGIEEKMQLLWRQAVQESIKEKKEPLISLELIHEMIIHTHLGIKKEEPLEDKDKLAVAIHETGHALAMILNKLELVFITCAGGKINEGIVLCGDKGLKNADYYLRWIRMQMAGMVAEEVCGLSASSGRYSDITNTHNSIKNLLEQFGVGFDTHSNSAFLLMIQGYKNDLISEDTLQKSDKDHRRIYDLAWQEMKNALEKIGEEKIRRIALIVKEKESLSGEEFTKVAEEFIGKKKIEELQNSFSSPF